MLAYKAKTVWTIYRRRMLWYLALVLLVTVGPQALVRPLRLYLCLSAGAVVTAFVGLNPTWLWQFSRCERVPPRLLWLDFGLGVLGALVATLGLATGHRMIYEIGALMAMAGVDCALLAHESNCRFQLCRLEPRQR